MQIREALVEEISKDLVGPRDENETLSDFPIGWYIAGILFPRGTEFEPYDEELMQAGENDDETEESEVVPINASFKQNSIGLSCNIKPEIDHIVLELQYAYYEFSRDNGVEKIWKRVPVKMTHTIRLDEMKNTLEIGNGEAKVIWSLQEGKVFCVLSIFLYNNLGMVQYE
jgi:hypothetical protein